MRVAYLDCASGISGDMTLGALVDVGAELAAIQAGIDSLGLPRCRLVASEVRKRGFRGTQVTVEHEPEHAHRHLADITAMIDHSALTPRSQDVARRIFQRLAEAEAKVHGTTIERVHFHEVGAVDSIADVVGAAIGFDLLGIERVVASPIPTGSGYIEIAHGRCSIPAPATAELLCGVPLADVPADGELTTPTGAAIVTTLAEAFGPLPAMTVDRIGYGAGQRDFPHANLLRLLVGEAAGEAVGEADSADVRPAVETIVVLETNLDDTCAEAIGYAVERLWEAGALDVSLTPMQMKKGRPGVLLSVQARPADESRLEAILFQETTTLGVRRQAVERTVLARRRGQVETRWGPVEGMIAFLPDGSQRFAPEYESCRRVADRLGVPLTAVQVAARQAFQAENNPS